nr:uncharacterized protein LOC114921369 [Labrus bergylta]
MMLKEQPSTRRGMLSVISSVYDPLGFLAPITLPAKIMLQELCRRRCGWDDNIPADIGNQWIRWLEDLKGMDSFKVERCIKPKHFGQLTEAQLHHFSDASQEGFGIVTYLRIENSKSSVHVSFLLGKARVTPLKQVTIPRVELTAAVLAVRVDHTLRAELDLPLDHSTFWTDSTVLKYIKNEDKCFHTFVANRVTTIRDATHVSQWRYIHTKENPADDASRGMKVGDLLNGGMMDGGPKVSV